MKLGPGDLIGVTGATGRIGRAFCALALERGYRLRTFGRRPVPELAQAEHVAFDLSDTASLDPSAFAGCNALVHLAAYIPRNHSSVEEADKCFRTNVLGTSRMIDTLAAAGVRRMVEVASANAYALWTGRTVETAPLFPATRTFYLGSKIAQELRAIEACRSYGIDLSTLRLSSVYGSDPDTCIIGKLIVNLSAGQAIQLTDEGMFGADFILVDDVAAAILLVLEKGTTGALNVGSGRRTTLAEVAERLLRLTGAPAELVHMLPKRADADLGFPRINNDRICALGFRPTPLNRALVILLHRTQKGDFPAAAMA